MGFGLNGLNFGQSSGGSVAQMITPKRQLSYTAVFSRMNTLQQVKYLIWASIELNISAGIRIKDVYLM
jgi:hypothetical protein